MIPHCIIMFCFKFYCWRFIISKFQDRYHQTGRQLAGVPCFSRAIISIITVASVIQTRFDMWPVLSIAFWRLQLLCQGAFCEEPLCKVPLCGCMIRVMWLSQGEQHNLTRSELQSVPSTTAWYYENMDFISRFNSCHLSEPSSWLLLILQYICLK